MSRYNAETTGEEIAMDCRNQIANKTILVTGASPGGLGAQFAVIIARHNPECIILATRDLAKAEETAEGIAGVAPTVRTHSIELDLQSLKKVKGAAEKISSLGENIDIIVNNAGIMATPYRKSVDGIESQFATNHIGHFLLTNLLLPKLLARNVPVRVVNVTSNGYRFGPVRFGDWNFNDGKTYERWYAYAQSKTANMLFSRSLAHKLAKQGLVSVSLHPGVIMTHLSRDLAMEDFADLGRMDREQGHSRYWGDHLPFKTPSQGVATHIFAAFHPDLDKKEFNGSYISDSAVESPEDVHSWARDALDAEKLWELSEKIVGQKFDF
ncbi:dehydrogenase [Bisporella sp. PMI_857]|nr:dehydrogenase [Bisporella sp. PMI_857]